MWIQWFEFWHTKMPFTTHQKMKTVFSGFSLVCRRAEVFDVNVRRGSGGDCDILSVNAWKWRGLVPAAVVVGMPTRDFLAF